MIAGGTRSIGPRSLTLCQPLRGPADTLTVLSNQAFFLRFLVFGFLASAASRDAGLLGSGSWEGAP